MTAIANTQTLHDAVTARIISELKMDAFHGSSRGRLHQEERRLVCRKTHRREEPTPGSTSFCFGRLPSSRAGHPSGG